MQVDGAQTTSTDGSKMKTNSPTQIRPYTITALHRSQIDSRPRATTESDYRKGLRLTPDRSGCMYVFWNVTARRSSS
jgi:hypothetical protein